VIALCCPGLSRSANGTSLADALLNLHVQHDVEASILVRGIRGFGLNRLLRTDISLSLSEDLLLAAIAVGTHPGIDAVLGQTLELNRSALVTVERARLVGETDDPVGIVENADEATNLSVYFSRRDSVFAMPAYEVMCELLYRREMPGATVLLGVDGMAHGRRPQAGLFSRDSDLPMMVVAVGPGNEIGMLLPELSGLLRRPLMTLERVRVCKRDGQLINVPELAAAADDRGLPLWQKLTVYTSEAAKHKGQPIHRAIVRRLRSAGMSGATTHRGVWGFHGDRPPHGDRFLQMGRHVPTVTTVIDTPERIFAAFDIIDEVTRERGLVTSENVSAIRVTSSKATGSAP
jgi:PII-like signaling protein